jgi:phage repressor protein C with HTH and peptisase S24 domain
LLFVENTRDRILKFIGYKQVNKAQFYAETGLSNGFLDKTANPGTDKLDKILTSYPEINLYWLVTGRGEMLRTKETAPNVAPIIAPNDIKEPHQITITTPKVVSVDVNKKETIIFVPVKAAAGYLNGFGDPEYIESLQAYRLPGFENGSFRMFEVDGHSMMPTLKSRDRIIGKWCELANIKDSYVYIIVTRNDGVVVKRVLNRIQKDGILILKSDGNRYEFPDKIIDAGDVMECWSGVGKISRDLSGPADLYSRLDDAEGRLAMIENLLKGK